MNIEVSEDKNSSGRYIGRCTGSSSNVVKVIVPLLQGVADYINEFDYPIRLESLTLDHPLESGDEYQIFFDYYKLEPEDISLRAEAKRLNTGQADLRQTIIGSDSLRLLRFSTNNDDLGQLFKAVVEGLAKYGTHLIEDLVFQDRLIEGGMHAPELRIYLSSAG